MFRSEPYADLPAFVCIPRGAEPPYTFFICVQGHSTGMHNSIAVERDDNARSMAVPPDRDFGLGCMKRASQRFASSSAPLGSGESRSRNRSARTAVTTRPLHALMLGRTLVGERVFDVDRGIDYLKSRGDADMRRIGVMGESGGGTTSLFAAALLPRIRYAMPSCYFCTFQDSIMSIYHCMDNYVPGLLKHAEMADVMGLFAPRPVVIVAGETDPIFPIAGTRRAFRHLKRIYAAAGAADRCHLVVGNGGHRFFAAEAWPVMLKEIPGNEKARE